MHLRRKKEIFAGNLHHISLKFLSVVSGVYAFAVLKQGVDAQKGDVSQQLKDIVSKRIAKYASPDCIQVILSHVQHNQAI